MYNAAQFFNFVFFYYVYIVWTVISTIFVIINFCGWSKPYSFKVILNHRLRPKQLYYLLSFLWIDLAMKFMKIGVSTNGLKKNSISFYQCWLIFVKWSIFEFRISRVLFVKAFICVCRMYIFKKKMFIGLIFCRTVFLWLYSEKTNTCT